jgi:hypothetical protein
MNAARVQTPGLDEDCYAWSVLRGPSSHHDVLHAFDRARRSIARKLLGHPGAFPGFDTLLLAPRPSEADSDVVLLTATVVARNENSHVVEYVATRVDGERDDATAWPTGDTVDVIARGVGRTLHCEPADRKATHRLTEPSKGDDEWPARSW